MNATETHLVNILAKAKFMKRRGLAIGALLGEAANILNGCNGYLDITYERRCELDATLSSFYN